MQGLIDADCGGIYHSTSEGVASWYDFALQAIGFARELGYPIKVCKLLPIPSSEYPTLAVRPHYAVLNNGKVRALLAESNPHWQINFLNMLNQMRDVDE